MAFRRYVFANAVDNYYDAESIYHILRMYTEMVFPPYGFAYDFDMLPVAQNLVRTPHLKNTAKINIFHQ